MKVVSVCQIPVTRVYDMEPAETAPEGPAIGQSWTDTSVTPPVVRTWDGTKWIVLNHTDEDISSVAGSVEKSYTNATKYAENIIMEAVKELITTTELGEYKQTVSTALEQTAKDFTLQFSTLNEHISDVNGDAQSQFEAIRKYIRMVDGKIVIGIEGNPLTLTLQNNRMSFSMNGVEVAYVSDNKLYITYAQVLSTMQIGQFDFTVEENGSLSFGRV